MRNYKAGERFTERKVAGRVVGYHPKLANDATRALLSSLTYLLGSMKGECRGVSPAVDLDHAP